MTVFYVGEALIKITAILLQMALALWGLTKRWMEVQSHWNICQATKMFFKPSISQFSAYELMNEFLLNI